MRAMTLRNRRRRMMRAMARISGRRPGWHCLSAAVALEVDCSPCPLWRRCLSVVPFWLLCCPQNVNTNLHTDYTPFWWMGPADSLSDSPSVALLFLMFAFCVFLSHFGACFVLERLLDDEGEWQWIWIVGWDDVVMLVWKGLNEYFNGLNVMQLAVSWFIASLLLCVEIEVFI